MAEAKDHVMATFRFNLIGAQPVVLEVPVRDIGELGALMSCQRLIEGRLAEAEGDGALLGMLIATSRIQCVVEAG